MAKKRDYYEILGVSRNATPDQIKKAYRRLARKHHPDVNPGDSKAEERFKEMQEAYEVLKDPEKRKKYDTFGHEAPGFDFPGPGAGHYRGSPFGYQTDFGGGFGVNMEDLFGEIFGAQAGRRSPRRGGDIESELTISLQQALTGLETKVNLPFDRECYTCGGEGEVFGKNVRTCPTCGGSGRAKSARGPLKYSGPCPTCKGKGKIGLDRCTTCGGQGRLNQEQLISVKIPPGVKDGSRIRVAGKGQSGSAGVPAGDLFINIHVERHPLFQREGDDLSVEMSVDFLDAILGGKLKVPTLDGTETTMTIPPGTQGGQIFRLRGKGMPRLKGAGRGDQLVKVKITVPKHPDAESKKLLEELKKRSS